MLVGIAGECHDLIVGSLFGSDFHRRDPLVMGSGVAENLIHVNYMLNIRPLQRFLDNFAL